MARKTEKKNENILEVVLLDDHTHRGKNYVKGDIITIKKRQLKRMQEWGKVK